MQILPPLPPDQRPPIPAFTPVPRKYRHDGWTPERQRAFIDALAATGSVTAAAARINMSTEGADHLRRQPGAEGFAAAWTAALDHGVQHLADLAIDRAMQGVPVPVFWKGEQVGERRRYNDRLLMFILKHHALGRYGGGLLPAPRSQAEIEQEAAENCPTCRERAEQAEAASAKAQADRAAFPPQMADRSVPALPGEGRQRAPPPPGRGGTRRGLHPAPAHPYRAGPFDGRPLGRDDRHVEHR